MPDETSPKKKGKKDKEIEVNAVYEEEGKTFQELMEELLKTVILK